MNISETVRDRHKLATLLAAYDKCRTYERIEAVIGLERKTENRQTDFVVPHIKANHRPLHLFTGVDFRLGKAYTLCTRRICRVKLRVYGLAVGVIVF